MKAFLIARVSTEDQKDALPAQVHKLVDYAQRQSFQYELIEFQESAYKGGREEFNRVIKKIQESKEIVAVVFDKVDRYTRDSSAEETRILQKLCKSGEIELHFPSDNLVVHKESPATDIMRLGLNAVLAQYYSDSISDNVKRRLQQKLRDGEWIGQAPYGYQNVTEADGKKNIVIDPEQAMHVRAIYEWYAGGTSSFKLIRKQLRESYGIDYSSSNIEYILKNPFYIGYMRSKGKTYPHKYEHIISDSLFERAKAVRESFGVKSFRYAGLPYSYRGLITCSDCGCLITFEKKKGKYTYGHCTQTKGKHNAEYVREELLTKQFEEVFKSIKIPESAYDELSEALKNEDEVSEQTQKEKLARIESDIIKYEKRIERVYEDYIDDKIPESLYQRKFEEFTEKVKELKEARKTFELVSNDGFNTAQHLLNISRDAPKLFKEANFEEKRSLIKMVHSNLELAGNQLRWELKKPYDSMALCSVSGNWLRGLGSNQRPRR